jgi:long-chain acyl-CoA synthetase
MAKFETLVDIFQDAPKTYPDNPLFGVKKNGAWQWMSYLDFAKKTDALRAGLHALGIKKGDKVALVSNNRPEWAMTAFACYGIGAAVVPMYEAQLPKDWEFIIKDCEATAFVAATDAIAEKAKSFFDTVPSLKYILSLDSKTAETDKVKSFAKLLETKEAHESLKPTPDDTACLIYTSGTTGNPKGVILSHKNLASNVSAMHECFPMSPMDRSLSFLPWAHAFGQTVELFGLFSMGASMAIAESVDKIIDNLAETKPTLLFSVPRIFNKLYSAVQKQISTKPPIIQSMVKTALKARGKQREGEQVGLIEGLVLALTDKIVFSKVRARFGGELKYAFSGGAAISREVAEFIDSLGVMVYEGYGLTETSPIATANWPNNRKIGSVGKPIPGVKISISDDGEIIVHGPNVMMGYHNRKEENDAVMTGDGGFKTGDMGKLDKDGFLFITGRLKEQYKLENGKYVVPTPLEEQLKLSPFVLNVMVYGDNKPYNVALVVANVGAIQKWGETNGVAEASIDKLLENPKVRALMKGDIEKYGEKFKGFEGVKDFALIGEDFTTENGMLTPSLKVKRKVVTDKYKPMIDALYAKKKEASDGKKKEASANAE